ncbi:prepilin-type N-terminal cleavage/methylation domain-containing protein [bacterium]|nr:MAG: prepilin-type N-terminal cleavage/methylation domain-containing protein [bacterium]
MIPSNKGLTIIELVVVIVVLGLAIPPLLTMWANVAWRSAASELLADSAFYAQQLMEEIKSKDFVDPDDPNNTNLGVNSGESSNDRTTFDDVDDFAGCADASVTTPAAGYTRSTAVDYVNLSGSAWQMSGSPTDYKRIVITVSRSGGAAIPVSLTALVSSH